MAETKPRNEKKIRCPACSKSFVVPATAKHGDKVPCPHCGTNIRLKPSSKNTDPFIGTTLAHCLIKKRLGKGSMGTVYEADRQGSAMAVKILHEAVAHDEELVARFQRETKLCMRLRHDNLMAAYDTGDVKGRPFLVMELIRGVALHKVVGKTGAMDWRKATKITLQIARALAYLHEQGVVHRDIKPENMLLGADKRAKLVDLGFAKVLEGTGSMAQEAEMELTMAGTALGSPAYMAPEQVMDAASADRATDCYCLAASYYHLVTGQMPYDGKTAMAVMEKVIHDDPTPPLELKSDLPKAVNGCILWGMQKDAKKRPQHAQELVEAFERILDNPEGSKVVPAVSKGGMPQWLIAVVLLLGVIAAVGIWLAIRG